MSNYSSLSCNFHEPSEFTNALKSKWDSLHEESGVFRYKIDKIKEKVVDGKYLLQLNPDRCIKRRTPELIDNIKQPFDNSKFNFTKVSKEEIIFTFKDDNDTHTILVNVSPISRHHSLFCPSVNKGLPQVMTQESLQLALDLLFLAQDRDLRIGFNSLCAFASVNHLHYHLLYEIKTLAIETAELKHVKGNLYKVDDKKYTVPAFCFEVQKQCNLPTIKEIHKLVKYFLDNSIAHNILITNKRNNVEYFNDVAKVFIWARKSTSGVKNFTAFNVAVCELSGWFPIFSEEAFDSLKSEDLENELRKWKIDDIGVCDLNK